MTAYLLWDMAEMLQAEGLDAVVENDEFAEVHGERGASDVYLRITNLSGTVTIHVLDVDVDGPFRGGVMGTVEIEATLPAAAELIVANVQALLAS